MITYVIDGNKFNICLLFCRAGKETYADNAVGYVQLKRDDQMCIVMGRITPEHKVKSKPYNVTAVINENNATIDSVKCNDCASSEGNFVLFLFNKN